MPIQPVHGSIHNIPFPDQTTTVERDKLQAQARRPEDPSASTLPSSSNPNPNPNPNPNRLLGSSLLRPVTVSRMDPIAAPFTHLVFSYGTLKRGFSNHTLIQSLLHSGDASFVGVRRTVSPYPLVCGPYRVPFLLNLPGKGERVSGELYAVTPKGIDRLDELEGISRGHYERVPVKVVSDDDDDDDVEVEVDVYFAHRDFTTEMWRRSGEKGFPVYTHKEAMGYIKRTDRPKDVSFLDKLKEFIAVPSS